MHMVLQECPVHQVWLELWEWGVESVIKSPLPGVRPWFLSPGQVLLPCILLEQCSSPSQYSPRGTIPRAPVDCWPTSVSLARPQATQEQDHVVFAQLAPPCLEHTAGAGARWLAHRHLKKHLLGEWMSEWMSECIHSSLMLNPCRGPSWWSSGKESACQYRGHGFDPWSGKIPYASQ